MPVYRVITVTRRASRSGADFRDISKLTISGASKVEKILRNLIIPPPLLFTFITLLCYLLIHVLSFVDGMQIYAFFVTMQ